ncbi:pentapeptide repeat-containing protein [Candidatus Methanocrinis alkalitolerans]|uniref:pentapeptide repeat-containing protein n=1 Tax=Candidatus Methanocrinis alkalitolerans TaxID=3033395 RepID=UPI003742BEDD
MKKVSIILARGLVNLGLVNLGLVNLGLVNLGLVNLSLVDLGLVNLSLVDLGLVNLSLVDLGLVNLSLVNLSLVDLGLVNLSLVDLGLVNLSLVDLGLVDYLVSLHDDSLKVVVLGSLEGDGASGLVLYVGAVDLYLIAGFDVLVEGSPWWRGRLEDGDVDDLAADLGLLLNGGHLDRPYRGGAGDLADEKLYSYP